jgi:hypothetical protein
VNRTGRITADDAAYLRRILEELRRRGPRALPAIRDMLRQGTDLDIAHLPGGDIVGHRTVRQALIDTLARIGGSGAIDVALGELGRSTDPLEVFMLARLVEHEEPTTHTDRVIAAVGTVLQTATGAPADRSPDVAPLFELLGTSRDERAIALLEQSVPQWREYALLALAGLPEGAGIPTLATLAARNDGPAASRALTFEVLAQASVRYDAAGDALLDLARAGAISDEAWGALAEALEGRHLRFSGRMFDGTPLAEEPEAARAGRSPLWGSYYVEWLNMRYEKDVVSPRWSAEQVARELALIDDLTAVAPSVTAVDSLQQARTALLHTRTDDDGSAAGG